MIDFNTVLLDQNNEPVKQNYKTSRIVDDKVEESNDYRETTLEDVARLSLLQSDDEDDPDNKLKRYQLFKKIAKKGEVDLNEDEKDLLIKYIALKHDVLFAGQAIELIK